MNGCIMGVPEGGSGWGETVEDSLCLHGEAPYFLLHLTVRLFLHVYKHQI